MNEGRPRVRGYLSGLGKLFGRVVSSTRAGRIFEEGLVDGCRSRLTPTSYGNVQLRLSSPTPLMRWRAETFSSKEPDTLEWIDGFTDGSVLWDIGANVGLYSVYAALARGCRVIAFEPSVFNLEYLVRNLRANNCEDLVTVVPLALSDASGEADLRLSSESWGGALSSFGVGFSFDGKPINEACRYRVLGLDADTLLETGVIPPPDYIKLDVDGIEHMIISGASKSLMTCRSILVEVNDDFVEQSSGCARRLSIAGFELASRRRAEILQGERFSNTYNQVWVRR